MNLARLAFFDSLIYLRVGLQLVHINKQVRGKHLGVYKDVIEGVLGVQPVRRAFYQTLVNILAEAHRLAIQGIETRLMSCIIMADILSFQHIPPRTGVTYDKTAP